MFYCGIFYLMGWLVYNILRSSFQIPNKMFNATQDSSITTPNFIFPHLNNNNDHDHACLIQTCIQYNSSKIPKVYKVLCSDRMLDWVFEYSVPSAFDLNMSEMDSSCNGLVCLIQHANHSNTDDAIYLWNPSITKQEILIDALSQ